LYGIGVKSEAVNVHVAEWGRWVGTREKATQKEGREGMQGRTQGGAGWQGRNRWRR